MLSRVCHERRPRSDSRRAPRRREKASSNHRRARLLGLGLIAATASTGGPGGCGGAILPTVSAAGASASAGGGLVLGGAPSLPNLMARSVAAAKSAASRGARGASRRIGDLCLPPVGGDPTAGTRSVKAKRRRRVNNTGFYYGIREDMILPPPERRGEVGTPPEPDSGRPQRPAAPGPLASTRPRPRSSDAATSRAALSDIMGETLLELREMREEIAALREEMHVMKRRMRSAVEYDDEEDDEGIHSGEIPGADRELLAQGEGIKPHEHEEGHGIGSLMARRKRAREFDRIGLAVEQWAEKLLFEEGGDEDGWKEVECNRMVRNKFNKFGTTRCYLKWMKDSRDDSGGTGVGRGGGDGSYNNQDEKEYPCVKVYTTIDAPLESVCAYLSDERRLKEYNDLVVAHRDLEEVSPHSKITWGQCPQILFVKPRDLVTFCHHRWKKDGTQVVVNQAVEHEDAPGHHEESDGKVCRAYALRGANFIGRDPDDPTKTRFALLAHADPGGGIPQWATRTAVNAVAPIEPFKLFHNIERGVRGAMEKGTCLPPSSSSHAQHRAEMASTALPGRSSRPAGLSQMGYACFWPNGGGLKEGWLHHEQHHLHDDDMYPHEQQPAREYHSAYHGDGRVPVERGGGGNAEPLEPLGDAVDQSLYGGPSAGRDSDVH